MSTLYIHPVETEEDYDDKENYSHNLNHYQSPIYLNQHQQYQQHQQHRVYPIHDDTSSTSSLKSVISSSCSTVPPPPTLFFPVDDDDKKNVKKNAKTVLSNLPALPPLSELTANDCKLLLNIEDLSSLNKLSIPEIQNELNTQRLKNETLLAKLHNDQKKFLKVCKHYEKKNGKLQQNVDNVAKKNKTSVRSAKVMVSLLVEHKSEVDLHQKENVQCQISKAALWKGIATNMQLLSEVNAFNKQIDAYHLLIAKKNQQNIKGDINDQENIKDDAINDDIKEGENDNINIDNSQFDTVSIPSNNTYSMYTDPDDPTASYAQQLIARNKRYHEILALLRKKVDELRECRKKL